MNPDARDIAFRSFFLAGFECSSHRRSDGHRLDLLETTGHARFCGHDYQAIARQGIWSVRDGVRWHLIDRGHGRYDWSSFLPMLEASTNARIQVIWDLCHYGWPDDIDIWSADFPARFAQFAAAVATLVRDQGESEPLYCPVNEISFWAWAGGEVGQFNPSATARGHALKRQLTRATIAAVAAVRSVDPRARFITAEPLIHVEPGSDDESSVSAAEAYRLAQFEALDLLSGRNEPDLGGAPDCLDVVGVNFYPHNQWYLGGSTIPMGHHAYRPLSIMLAEVHARYGRPILISETGAEGSGRASWLHYVCAEVRRAMDIGVPVAGICLYPVLDYPGWENGRSCEVGLFSTPDEIGRRHLFVPLAAELADQAARFARSDWRAPRSPSMSSRMTD